MSVILENPIQTPADEANATLQPGPERPETDEESLKSRLQKWGTSYDACGFYWSVLIHLGFFCVLVLVLWWLDLFYIREAFRQIAPVRAALSDKEVEDEEPQLEMIPEITIEPSGGLQAFDDTLSTVATLSDLAPEVAFDVASLTGAGEGPVGDGDGDQFVQDIAAGGNAVTKGSFTAWTVPENPNPGQNYMIVIQVQLPPKVRRLKAGDLSGIVVGTDKYEQRIPFDRRAPGMTRTMRRKKAVALKLDDYLPLNDRKAQIMVWVPGAARLVRDKITIRSRILKEEQMLELVFGSTEEDGDGK